jgi:hypothetical protein
VALLDEKSKKCPIFFDFIELIYPSWYNLRKRKGEGV